MYLIGFQVLEFNLTGYTSRARIWSLMINEVYDFPFKVNPDVIGLVTQRKNRFNTRQSVYIRSKIISKQIAT